MNEGYRGGGAGGTAGAHTASIPLPDWLFDIDAEDEPVDPQKTIWEELSIDKVKMYNNIRWSFIRPVKFLFKLDMKKDDDNYYNSHIVNSELDNTTASIVDKANVSIKNDFWGPCLLLSMYALLLWMAQVRNPPWVYVIWAVSATVLHLITRVWYSKSTLTLHYELLGYSVTPLIPVIALIVISRPPLWIAYVLELAAVVWSSTASFYSYKLFLTTEVLECSSPNKDNSRNNNINKLVPPLVLFYMYLVAIVPLKY